MKQPIRTLRLITASFTGCLKVLMYAYGEKIFRRSFQPKIQQVVRERANRILHIAKSRVTIKKAEPHDFHRPCIYMSNHLSLLDIPLIYSGIPGKIRFIAKHSLFTLPIFGQAIKAGGVISVEEKNLYDHLKSILISSGSSTALWIFPEGHRSSDGKLLPFKPGGFSLARELGAIIIPVGLKGTDKLLPPHSLSLHPGIPTEINIGKAIDCLDYPKPEQLMDLIHAVRNEIALLRELRIT